MKKQITIILIGLLLISFTSALIEARERPKPLPRPQPNPLLRSQPLEPKQNELQQGFDDVVNSLKGEDKFNLSNKTNEEIIQINNNFIEKKFNLTKEKILPNISKESNVSLNSTDINFSLEDIDLWVIIFFMIFIAGVLLIVFIIFSQGIKGGEGI